MVLQGIPYGRNRVFNNYSGNRPAEPSSVAAVAVWHTLTRLLLQLVFIVRNACPEGRLLLPWEVKAQAHAASLKVIKGTGADTSTVPSSSSSATKVRVGVLCCADSNSATTLCMLFHAFSSHLISSQVKCTEVCLSFLCCFTVPLLHLLSPPYH